MRRRWMIGGGSLRIDEGTMIDDGVENVMIHVDIDQLQVQGYVPPCLQEHYFYYWKRLKTDLIVTHSSKTIISTPSICPTRLSPLLETIPTAIYSISLTRSYRCYSNATTLSPRRASRWGLVSTR